MSEHSSDSDSSCGWTVVSHEGSDVEMVNSGTAGDSLGPTPGCCSSEREVLPVLQTQPGAGSSWSSAMLVGEAACPTPEVAGATAEASEVPLPALSTCFGTTSDDSDIVTLEPPKPEEVGSQDLEIAGESHSSEDFNMGSSTSSQYTFCQPEAAFSAQPSEDESSSDETGDQRSPALRRRRGRKKTLSTSGPEDQLLAEPEREPMKEPSRRRLSSGLNKCVVLALVIAVSMGFGHFYGTVQIEKRQQIARKIHDDESTGATGFLSLRQEQQEAFLDPKPMKGSLGSRGTRADTEKSAFETRKDSLAEENEHLRSSLEKEAQTVWALQEELRKLRQRAGAPEGPGAGAELARENELLRRHLQDLQDSVHSVLEEKKVLLTEASVLKSALEEERLTVVALRSQLERPDVAGRDEPESGELLLLRQRLAELQRRLTFEQQRSDLWERLYVEAKDEQARPGGPKKKKGARGSPGAGRAKDSFLGAVKETFDAMKNSTKEFVRHHKEKIKQAKEAVKENLRKFSDSVKSTFRHFKDSTRNIFDDKGGWRCPVQPRDCRGGPAPSRDGRRAPARPWEGVRDGAEPRRAQDCRRARAPGGHGHGEHPLNVARPVRLEHFRLLIAQYLREELSAFHHWEELDQFLGHFFPDGLFQHERTLFTDFLRDLEGYVKGLDYAVDGTFDKLDGFLSLHLAHPAPLPYGPSRPAKKHRMVNIDNSKHRKQEQKHLQLQPYKREGKRHKSGHANRRPAADLEIELGRLPFDPKC